MEVHYCMAFALNMASVTLDYFVTIGPSNANESCPIEISGRNKQYSPLISASIFFWIKFMTFGHHFPGEESNILFFLWFAI